MGKSHSTTSKRVFESWIKSKWYWQKLEELQKSLNSMISLKDNFSSQNYLPYKYIQPIGKLKDKSYWWKLEINLNDYQDKKYPNNTFSSFKDEEKAIKNEDDLIISIKK